MADSGNAYPESDAPEETPLTYEQEVAVAKMLIKQGLLAQGYTDEEADYVIEHSAPIKLDIAQRVLVREFVKAIQPALDAVSRMAAKLTRTNGS